MGENLSKTSIKSYNHTQYTNIHTIYTCIHVHVANLQQSLQTAIAFQSFSKDLSRLTCKVAAVKTAYKCKIINRVILFNLVNITKSFQLCQKHQPALQHLYLQSCLIPNCMFGKMLVQIMHTNGTSEPYSTLMIFAFFAFSWHSISVR